MQRKQKASLLEGGGTAKGRDGGRMSRNQFPPDILPHPASPGAPSKRGPFESAITRKRAPSMLGQLWERSSIMSLPYQRDLILRAKELRKAATRWENHLWYDFLRTYPVRFQRQKTIRRFIVDFYCHQAKLAIELDGSQHHTEQGSAYDTERDAVLSGLGIQILRFTNWQIEQEFPCVCAAIDQAVQQSISRKENAL